MTWLNVKPSQRSCRVTLPNLPMQHRGMQAIDWEITWSYRFSGHGFLYDA